MQAKPDYYGVLGVGRKATTPEVRAAFQKLASAFHAEGKPRNIDDVEEIRRYATAYRVLSDAKKREYYDRTGFHPLEAEPLKLMEPFPQKVEGFWDAFAEVAGIVIDKLGS